MNLLNTILEVIVSTSLMILMLGTFLLMMVLAALVDSILGFFNWFYQKKYLTKLQSFSIKSYLIVSLGTNRLLNKWFGQSTPKG
jgi:hypothetical protein